jgi:hypothetical protein
MATMDIFESDAFSVIELTRALENIPFKPALLSGSGLFGARGVRTRTVVTPRSPYSPGTSASTPSRPRASSASSCAVGRRSQCSLPMTLWLPATATCWS